MARFSGEYKLRFYFLTAVVLVSGGLLAGRLFFIQIRGHEYYAYQAERQLNADQSKSLIAIRGNIYFKEKSGNLLSAAVIKEGFLAALNPKLVVNPEEVCNTLYGVIPLNLDTCIIRAAKKDDPFEEIVHRLSYEQAGTIRNLGITGVNVYPEQWRFNPGNSLASHVLGFVGYAGDSLVGRYGLEQYYEDVLKGKKESLAENQSFASVFLQLGKDILGTEAHSGRDLILTIEPNVQGVLERQIETVLEKWQAESAGGIVMDPKTGAVIAMAAKPDFDPNKYNEVNDISVFRNPLVSNQFEMGSVFKPLTLAAALDAGKIAPETTYIDNGFVVADGARIENYDGKARGKVNMQEVLNQSLNTGAVFVMKQLGKENFRQYFTNYGLGEKTGIDLIDEINGNLKNLNSPREVEYASASFGQGIAVTPIEFISAVSALANEGIIMRPYIVEKIFSEGGRDVLTVPQSVRRVIKPEAAEEITRMLVRVVDEALVGGTARQEHYSVAAKTGTAQIPDKEGGYYEDKYLHSFFGYAPAFDAKFAVFLYLEKPQGVRYASQSLTPPFMELIKFLLNYYEMPPDR